MKKEYMIYALWFAAGVVLAGKVRQLPLVDKLLAA